MKAKQQGQKQYLPAHPFFLPLLRLFVRTATEHPGKRQTGDGDATGVLHHLGIGGRRLELHGQGGLEDLGIDKHGPGVTAHGFGPFHPPGVLAEPVAALDERVRACPSGVSTKASPGAPASTSREAIVENTAREFGLRLLRSLFSSLGKFRVPPQRFPHVHGPVPLERPVIGKKTGPRCEAGACRCSEHAVAWRQRSIESIMQAPW